MTRIFILALMVSTEILIGILVVLANGFTARCFFAVAFFVVLNPLIAHWKHDHLSQ